jgi:hypothetical protein
VVRVGVVDAGGGDREQLLAVPGDRVGQVDDVQVICTARMGEGYGPPDEVLVVDRFS